MMIPMLHGLHGVEEKAIMKSLQKFALLNFSPPLQDAPSIRFNDS